MIVAIAWSSIGCAVVAAISFVVMFVIGAIKTLEKYWVQDASVDSDLFADSQSPGDQDIAPKKANPKMTRAGKVLLGFHCLAFICGLFSLIVTFVKSANSSEQLKGLVIANTAQAAEINSQSSKMDEMQKQANSNQQEIVRSNGALSEQLAMTSKQLADVRTSANRTERELAASREDYRILLAAVNDGTNDVKGTVREQAESRAKREAERMQAERIEAERRAHENQLRRNQPYLVTLQFPQAQGVSVMHEGKQVKNVFVYIYTRKGIIKLQCEPNKGVEWGVGTTGKECSLVVDGTVDRQNLPDNQITVIGGALKFDGELAEVVDIPFPQEVMPTYEVTY